jgi:hypothetical protein
MGLFKPKMAARRAVIAKIASLVANFDISDKASLVTLSAARIRTAVPPPPCTATIRPRLNSEMARSTESNEAVSRLAGMDGFLKFGRRSVMVYLFYHARLHIYYINTVYTLQSQKSVLYLT